MHRFDAPAILYACPSAPHHFLDASNIVARCLLIEAAGFSRSGLFGDRAVVQVDDLSVSDLAGEVVLQRSPFTQHDTAIAAMDLGVLARTLRNIHLDCPAGFAVELMI